MNRECAFCEGGADFLWFDDNGQWFVCTGCIKEGLTDAEPMEDELCDECGAPHEEDIVDDIAWSSSNPTGDFGQCDTCGDEYDPGDSLTRCGECGNCGECCTHERLVIA